MPHQCPCALETSATSAQLSHHYKHTTNLLQPEEKHTTRTINALNQILLQIPQYKHWETSVSWEKRSIDMDVYVHTHTSAFRLE